MKYQLAFRIIVHGLLVGVATDRSAADELVETSDRAAINGIGWKMLRK